MRKPVLTSLALVVLLTLTSLAFGQQMAIQAARQAKVAAFTAYAEALDGERTYLHTDRPRYLPGQDIWFQAYLRADADLTPAHKSGILHVELFDPRGTLVQRIDLGLKKGVASGDFHLNPDAAGGLYKLRASTVWQQNEEDPFYFEKELTVSKAVYPALKLKMDLDREAYGPGDEVIAEVKLEDLQNRILADKEVAFSVNLAGREYQTGSVRSQGNGKAFVVFQLPQVLTNSDGLVNVIVHHEGKSESISRSIPIILNDLRVELFPEGGDLVAGLPARVAFQAWNEHNKPADFSGKLVDGQGRTLTEFDSYHMGIGAFSFTPEAGVKYAVQVTRPAGVAGIFALPPALETGFSLTVEQPQGSYLPVRIQTSQPDQGVFLIAQMRGKIYHSQALAEGQSIREVNIPLREMPAGVLQITLYNINGYGLAERLAFVNKDKLLDLQIETDKEEYLPREKVTLKIKTRDQSGKALPAQVSLAVVNDKVLSFADDKQSTLLSALLLEADLKGSVHEPRFYFDPEEEKADQALDFLLMTRGWRKFEWRKVDDLPVAKVDAETGVIAGYVYDWKGKPMEGVEVSSNISTENYEVFTDATGKFLLEPGLDLGGSRYFNLRKKGYQSVVLSFAQARQQNPVIFLVPEGEQISFYNQGYSNPGNKIFYSDSYFGQNFYNYYSSVPLKYVLQSNTSEVQKIATPRVDMDQQMAQVQVVKKEPELIQASTSNFPGSAAVSRNTVSIQADRIVGVQEVEFEEDVQLESVVITAGRHISMQNCLSREVIHYVDMNNWEYGPWRSGYVQYHVDGVDVWVGDGLGIYLQDVPNLGNWNLPPPKTQPPFLKNQKEIQEKIGASPVIASGEALGRVRYRVLVGKKGQIKAIVPLQAGDPALFDAAKWYLPELDFKPGWVHGSRSDIWTSVEFAFIPAGAQPVNVQAVSNFYQARIFSAPVYSTTNQTGPRMDYRETLFWKGDITTDENGEAEVNFYNSDEVTSFRATAEGISESGLPGRAEHTFHTLLPLAMDVRIPHSVSTSDLVRIPLTLKNNTDAEISGAIQVKYPKSWQVNGELPASVNVSAGEVRVEYLDFRILPGSESAQLTVSLEASGMKESVSRTVWTEKKGFPQEVFVSGIDLDQAWDLTVNEPLEGSMQASLTAFPNVISEAMESMKSMLRRPTGCFEQTTSSNWPNLLVTRYLIESGIDDHATKKQAIQYLEEGYNRLAGFEAPTGGFDWFGRTPGNLRLSVYGLLQFSLQDQLIGGVSQPMMNRTREWVLSHRDGKGNFVAPTQHDLHFSNLQLGGSQQDITNCYVLFALARSGYQDLERELNFALENARANQDPYQVSLLANACLALGLETEANAMIRILLKTQNNEGNWTGKVATMVGSTGKPLDIESTALACVALMKGNNPDHRGAIELGIRWLQKERNGFGAYGPTQTTVQAMEAMTDYSLFSKADREAGKIELTVNGQVVDVVEYSAYQRKAIEFEDWSKNLKVGKNRIRVRYLGTKKALPFALGISWQTNLPTSAANLPLTLDTRLSATTAKVGETVRLTATLKNQENSRLGCPIALIGIPGGLSVQDWQLKELKEKGQFDFYELKGQYVILYYEYMEGRKVEEINLDLKAEVPGQFEAPASSAYPYYNDTEKDWASAGKIVVNP